MPARNVLSATVLSAVLACAAPYAVAQGKGVSETGGATAAQQEKHGRIMEQLNQQVAAAFAGEEALRATMAADLAKIETEKDPSKQAAMVKAYQAKYARDYQRVLAGGKVDLTVYARQLDQVYPDMKFKVVDGAYIRGDAAPRPSGALPSGAASASSSASGAMAAAPVVPAEHLRGTHILDFSRFNYTAQDPNRCAPTYGRNAVAGRVAVSEARSTGIGGCNLLSMREMDIPVSPAGGARLTNLSVRTEHSGRITLTGAYGYLYGLIEMRGDSVLGGTVVRYRKIKFVYKSFSVAPYWVVNESYDASALDMPASELRASIANDDYGTMARSWHVKLFNQAHCAARVGWCYSDSKMKVLEVKVER